jgi:hypothetical protein
MTGDERTATERVVTRGVEDELGRPLSRHARTYERSVEAHLRANDPPRWMQRLVEIERGTASARADVERAWHALRAECGHDPAAFARRWRAAAGAWRFDALNELIRQHNEWYPVERDLPLDPRTGEYRHRFRRDELDAFWILSRFPADP